MVSAGVAVVLTAMAYAAGWVPVSVPRCDPTAPFACVQSSLGTAGGAMALANELYVAVYGRVFGRAAVQ